MNLVSSVLFLVVIATFSGCGADENENYTCEDLDTAIKDVSDKFLASSDTATKDVGKQMIAAFEKSKKDKGCK